MRLMEQDSFIESAKLFNDALKLGGISNYYSIQALYTFAVAGNDRGIIKVLNNFPKSHLNNCEEISRSVVNFNHCALVNDILNDTVIMKQISQSKNASKLILSLIKKQRIQYTISERIVFMTLIEINNLDQKYRKLFLENPSDSIKDLLVYYDSINFHKFINLIRKNGWPSQKKYGTLSELPLWHCNIEEEYLVKASKKAANRKDLDWDSYEHFIRRTDDFCNKVFKEKKIVIDDLKLKKSEMGNIQNYIDFLVDCFNFYRIDPKRLQIEIYLTDNQIDKSLDLLVNKLPKYFEDYDSNFANIPICIVKNSNFENKQISIRINDK